MKKIFSILVIFIFLISFTSALDCWATLKQNDDIELLQKCPSCSFVNITSITYPNGTIFLNEVMQQEGINFNYTLPDSSQIGIISYGTIGDKNGASPPLWEDLCIKITATGRSLETSESLLYIIILLVTFLLFLGLLYPAITLPYQNDVNPDGTITKITKLKYLKLLSIWFSYGFFMWFLQTLSGISTNYISLNFLSNFISNIFIYSWSFSTGITFLILTILFINAWKDILWSKQIKEHGKAFIDGRFN